MVRAAARVRWYGEGQAKVRDEHHCKRQHPQEPFFFGKCFYRVSHIALHSLDLFKIEFNDLRLCGGQV